MSKFWMPLQIKLFLLTCRRGCEKAAGYDEQYFDGGLEEMKHFCNAFPGGIQVSGKRLLDMGCGHGSACIFFALQGAQQVVGMDVDPHLIAFAKDNLERNYPALRERVRFSLTPQEIGGSNFDIVVSKDVLEHVSSAQDYMAEIASRLKSGGRLYAGFAPLWNSMYGGHGRMRTQLPWGHLIFPEHIIMAGLRKLDDPVQHNSIHELGLSKLSFSGLKHVIQESGLRRIFFRTNVGKSLKNELTKCARLVPGLTEYFTHSVFFVLEKNTWA